MTVSLLGERGGLWESGRAASCWPAGLLISLFELRVTGAKKAYTCMCCVGCVMTLADGLPQRAHARQIACHTARACQSSRVTLYLHKCVNYCEDTQYCES